MAFLVLPIFHTNKAMHYSLSFANKLRTAKAFIGYNNDQQPIYIISFLTTSLWDFLINSSVKKKKKA